MNSEDPTMNIWYQSGFITIVAFRAVTNWTVAAFLMMAARTRSKEFYNELGPSSNEIFLTLRKIPGNRRYNRLYYYNLWHNNCKLALDRAYSLLGPLSTYFDSRQSGLLDFQALYGFKLYSGISRCKRVISRL